ncbi:Sugar phosphate permease [Natronorubrum sediminis]|uniref:Sugar phosphate permease n=1 Tax=Natronorubrum sediminis TaxID=640943 RepID=A0A1H6FRC7_9EURY|nr:MFS transporter [Natronorubrum sediminis]SEH13449.1 Sugar phosphate permease [Natronorubrum sediminis]
MKWRYTHTALVLCTLAFMGTMVARLSISPLVPAITDDFGVSNAAVGFALSLMWATYALAQFPSGIFGDRFGERRVILTAIGLTGVASIFLAISPTFGLFVVFAIVLGFGAGLHYTPATTYLTKQFDDIGRAIGFHIAGSPAAGLVAPVAAALIASFYGWRAGILIGALFAIPLFVLFIWRIRPTTPTRPEQPMRERVQITTIFELLSRPSIAYTTLIAFLCAFTWQATASFLPAFFEDGQGLSASLASALFSLYFLAHGLTQPLTGWLSDRFGRDATTVVSMSAGVLGYGALVVADSLAIYALSVCFIGLAMSWGAPVQSRFMDSFTDAERSTGFGLVRTVYMTTGASGSVAVGALADFFGWEAAFAVLAGIMALVCATIATNRVLRLGL